MWKVCNALTAEITGETHETPVDTRAGLSRARYRSDAGETPDAVGECLRGGALGSSELRFAILHALSAELARSARSADDS